MGFLNQPGCLLTILLDPHLKVCLACGLLMLHILLLRGQPLADIGNLLPEP
jgi:hypothetical protein